MNNILSQQSAADRISAILSPLSKLVTKLTAEVGKIDAENERLDAERRTIEVRQAENTAAKDQAEKTLGKLQDLLA